ncbi:MAG: AAA family ATPase, partial [FCB group bacterium]|nr:AAA family ATPase [FCB group bacterium]
MYISKLHIQGFKSFLNKTDLQFGEGITSIVGPNGCGKSNIVDAIRWILGEQKTTVLRSQKMEDVIFKGAKNYKPLGFCEVSLTINNDKGRLPLEYTEIEITRRFYRSGESEYLLNKVPCRLKDITGLFMDSGLSPNAYSVIELKMIDSIISHNPDERKKLFEEAAGINYYKQQRQTTFRKLEAARIDLDRVADIILEVENNVNSLRLQLKRFERHKKLSDKLVSSEILLAQAEIQLLEMEAAPLEARVSERRSRQAALSGQVNLDEELIAETQGKFEAAKVELENYSESVNTLEKKLGEINNNLLIWTEQKKAGELRIKQYSDESVQTKTRIETIQRQIEELNLEINAHKPHIEAQKAAFREKSQEYNTVASRYREAETRYNTLRKKLDSQLERVYQAESGFHKTRAEIEEKRNLIERLQEQKKGFLERLSARQFEADELQGRLNQIEKINSGLSLEVEKLQEEQAKAEELLIREKEIFSKTQSGLTALTSRYQFYQKIISTHEGKPSGTKYILTHQDDFKGIIGCVSDLLSVEESHRIAVETALGEALNYIVVDTTDNALQNLNRLKEKTDFGISFVTLDGLGEKQKVQPEKDFPGAAILSVLKYDASLAALFTALLGDVRLVESKELRELKPEHRRRYNWVSNGGDYLGRSTVIKFGGKSKESLIGRQDQLVKLEAEIESTEKKLLRIENNIQNLKSQADAVRLSLKQKTKQLDESVSDSGRLEKELAQHRYSCQHQKERLKENDEIISENLDALKLLGIRQTKLNEALNELKSEYKSIQTEIAA